MPRPRKDGKPPARAVRIGRKRTTDTGKTWQVRAYDPTDGAPYGRVVYIRPGSDNPTSSVPADGESLDDVFERVERYLDQGVALAGTPTAADTDTSSRRDITALSALYLNWLRLGGRDAGYIANRKSLITKWIIPVIGTLLVANWGPEESARVIENARPNIGAARLNDLGSVLSGMRATAHRKRPGGRWLSPDENPLEGVSYGRSAGKQGASSKWVPPHRRPATDMVLKAIGSAGELGRWEWLPDAIGLSAFCASRQGELLGFRAVDVDLDAHDLDVNGAWATPPSGQRAGQGKVRVGHRKPHPKNGLRRTTPYLGSQHDMLRRRAALALGLPASTAVEALARLIRDERERRAAMTATGDWRDADVPSQEEAWLFPAEDGLPPSKEQFNDAWHVVRDAVQWTHTIPYRNLRHHAILWWKNNLPGIGWETLADWSGHDVRTLQGYYVIASEDATSRARPELAAL